MGGFHRPWSWGWWQCAGGAQCGTAGPQGRSRGRLRRAAARGRGRRNGCGRARLALDAPKTTIRTPHPPPLAPVVPGVMIRGGLRWAAKPLPSPGTANLTPPTSGPARLHHHHHLRSRRHHHHHRRWLDICRWWWDLDQVRPWRTTNHRWKSHSQRLVRSCFSVMFILRLGIQWIRE